MDQVIISEKARMSIEDAFALRWQIYNSPSEVCTRKKLSRPLYDTVDAYIEFVLEVLGIDIRSTHKRSRNIGQEEDFNVLLDHISVYYEVIYSNHVQANHVNILYAKLSL